MSKRSLDATVGLYSMYFKVHPWKGDLLDVHQAPNVLYYLMTEHR